MGKIKNSDFDLIFLSISFSNNFTTNNDEKMDFTQNYHLNDT